MGCHPSHWRSLHHFSRWWNAQPPTSNDTIVQFESWLPATFTKGKLSRSPVRGWDPVDFHICSVGSQGRPKESVLSNNAKHKKLTTSRNHVMLWRSWKIFEDQKFWFEAFEVTISWPMMPMLVDHGWPTCFTPPQRFSTYANGQFLRRLERLCHHEVLMNQPVLNHSIPV